MALWSAVVDDRRSGEPDGCAPCSTTSGLSSRASAASVAIWEQDRWDGTNEVYSDVIEAWEDGSNDQDTEYVYGAAKHPEKVTTTTYPDSGEVVVSYNDDGTVATRVDQRSWTATRTYGSGNRQ
jgi:hypothetical protein